ncbi:general amidase [Dacryopinax primogenitus]|uniref:amidase n=1 Tax=Dacryopinax primogenitus (strain DJM 731) TaxID=1858805 RepID=M5G109_DACPD|nr:general amidase [Dacryopinax primogenitus]EJU01835.1 general amidase [Dacryopinax primogenitus]
MGDTATAVPTKEDWKTVAARKKAAQLAALPKEWIIDPPELSRRNVTNVPAECGLLTPRELEITDTKDVALLLEKLAKGEYTAVEVTTAFYKRAVIAHQMTNCLTEIYIEKAVAWATSLDKALAETGKPVGLLHGLPISLKDQISIAGLDTVMGYVAWIDKPAEKNSVLVDILLEQGAVPFVRTNVPQTLMWGETFNVVFGRTVNPHNRTLTPGGSSGGEGALLGMGGSPLGVGSDIGGSIRNPSSVNGLYGLRPSYDRIPYEGSVTSGQGQEGIVSVLGPMTRHVSGLKIFTKAVLDAKPWTRDPYCIRKPWDAESYALAEHGEGKKMCFAILWHDGIVRPLPPIRRALEKTKAALEAAGHTIIDWEPPVPHGEMRPIATSIFGAAAGEDVIETVKSSGEPALSTMDPLRPPPDRVDVPEGGKLVWKRDGRPDPVPLSSYEFFNVCWNKRAMQKKYLDGWMATKDRTGTGRPVDALITPAGPYPAPTHGNHIHAFFTTWCNILDYPAAIFPVTKVDQELDQSLQRTEFLGPEDEKVHGLYTSPDVFADAPISLQLVGQRWEEEAVIGMTEVVDAALAAYQ